MRNKNYIQVKNEEPFNIADIPELNISEFRDTVVEKIKRNNERILSFFGHKHKNNTVKLFMVLGSDHEGLLSIFSTVVEKSYQALTPICMQANMFEREIAEQWGIIPNGHPWLKPVRYHHSYIDGQDAWNRSSTDSILPADTNFYRVEGKGIHEVAVGPIHAGVIEPGHFRFQCEGETVLNLEIALGFQHRGIEKAMLGGPNLKSIHFAETISGDSTIAHTTAYCGTVKGLGKIAVSSKALIIRGIALELERMANHIGDLGALSGDVAYLPTASFCGRIRGDILNLTAEICGNRFGRSLLSPNGVLKDLNKEEAKKIGSILAKRFDEAENAIGLLWKTPSVLSRFENTGKITSSVCSLLGIVGMPARSCGLKVDTRINYPTGIYSKFGIQMTNTDTGDVHARAMLRWQEIVNSKNFILKLLDRITSEKEDISEKAITLMADMGIISLVEGWRGEVCHTAFTDNRGKFSAYKIVDPSFHNWQALAMALRNEQISNFPLCNKSFNLSYCGHDL